MAKTPEEIGLSDSLFAAIKCLDAGTNYSTVQFYILEAQRKMKNLLEPATPAPVAATCGQSDRDARLIEGLENHEIIYYGPRLVAPRVAKERK